MDLPHPTLRRCFAAAILAVSAIALTDESAQAQQPSDFLTFTGNAQKVWGYADWCRREKVLCADDFKAVQPAFLPWNKKTKAMLESVNKNWNHGIEAKTDLEIYGVQEYWTIPAKAGDCEDYVLGKRQELIDRGVPRNALLITLVIDKDGNGHAVLSVQTDRDTRILDNMTDDVKSWYETPYKFIKSQNPYQPSTWLAINNTRPLPKVHYADPKNKRDPIAALIRQSLD